MNYTLYTNGNDVRCSNRLGEYDNEVTLIIRHVNETMMSVMKHDVTIHFIIAQPLLIIEPDLNKIEALTNNHQLSIYIRQPQHVIISDHSCI